MTWGGSTQTADQAVQPVLTIKEMIGQVHGNKCLLPIPKEGELIWPAEQIARLFGELMQERSIGQFILWSTSRDKASEFRFCQFSENGRECLKILDLEPFIAGQNNVAVVIDGKRRLASLYVGLVGFPGGLTPTEDGGGEGFFRARKLYLNLLSEASRSEARYYDFRFLTESEASSCDETSHWFEVGKVLDFRKPEEIDKYLLKNGLEKNMPARDCLARLHKVINEKRTVRYVVETDDEVGKVFMLFL